MTGDVPRPGAGDFDRPGASEVTGDRSAADSSPELLTLHAVRILGFADTDDVIIRFGIPREQAEPLLRGAQDRGWLQYSSFGGSAGWSLTAEGRVENERALAEEVNRNDGRELVEGAYTQFLPLNARLLQACTDWQLRPRSPGRLEANDHTNPEWDGRILVELDRLSEYLVDPVTRLTTKLNRFSGYDRRFSAACLRARNGDGSYVDRTDRDSCHRVWFELHEDLVATLGLAR